MQWNRPTLFKGPNGDVLCSPLIYAAEDFRAVLDAARAAIAPKYFSWYPYDSLGNAVNLTKLLQGTAFDLVSMVRGKRILDLGCADGDFAFFLESLGAEVVAVDHPRGSHNNLAGINALKQYLGSSVDVRTVDLDTGLTAAHGECFEFALALGLLYHLKNPFQFLESLSKLARYSIISTRIMRRLPDSREDISAFPIAYLLGADELNADNSNFWIFSDSGLRRLLHRAHWKIHAWISVGDTVESMPHNLANDERAFCLIESTWGDIGIILGEGWHQPEDTGWRWTARRFTAHVPHPGDAGLLTANIYVPDALTATFGPVSLQLRVNGAPVAQETFPGPGLYSYTRRVPVGAPRLDLDFSASAALPPDVNDNRERSFVIESIRFEAE